MSHDNLIKGYIIVCISGLIIYNFYLKNYSVLFFYMIFLSPYITQFFKDAFTMCYKKYKFYTVYSKICQNLKFKEIQDVENQIDNKCSICLDTVEMEDEISIIPCGCIQLYHHDCIYDWLKINPSCPSCRKEFV
jgi:hypothetical protein